MKKYCLLICILLSYCLIGCSNSNQATIDVLETCKVIDSVITETSISANKEYFTITFENELFYCQDNTNGRPVYTIKIPTDAEFDMYAIIKSIAPSFSEEDFDELNEDNYATWFKAHREYWRCNKSIEGNTIKYTLQ